MITPFLLLLSLSPNAPEAATLRVPADFATIQEAMDAALPGDTVLVADGVHKGVSNRDLRFGGKAITVRSENGATSCQIDCEGTPERPYRGFIFDNFETRASVLQGFTITGGATLPGAIADQFNGGGILIQSASPTIRDCSFVDNHAGCWGGAIYAGDTHSTGVGQTNPLIENCIFDTNLADDEGGAFFSWGQSKGSRITVRNSVFLGNVAGAGGGAVTSFGGLELTLDHVTMIGNFAPTGENAWLGDSVIKNSILWNTGDDGLREWSENEISYSLVKGGAIGIGNLDVDPMLKADGFHLRTDSPCVNAGEPGPANGERDIDGQPRRIGVRTDIGADELRPRLYDYR